MKGRVFLVEPSEPLRRNLEVLLSSLEGFRIVGQSSSGLDAIRNMPAIRPDILILDLSLADMIAMDIVRWTGKLLPKTRVIILSTHDLPEYRLAARRLKNAVFISKAEVCRELPETLKRLRREQLAREQELGAVWLAKCGLGLRCLATWVSQTASQRDQVPIWRFIHMAMALLSVELIMVPYADGSGVSESMVAGWTVILAALVHDFYTLRGRAVSPTTFHAGDIHRV